MPAGSGSESIAALNRPVRSSASDASENLRPLQFGLATFAQGSGSVQWPFLMAMSALATLPVILLFIFGQRYFIAGMATSGIKG